MIINTGLSPLAIKLKGTLDIAMHAPKAAAAITNPKKLLTTNIAMIYINVPIILTLGSNLCIGELPG